MGIDELVTGGDVYDPVVDSIDTDRSHITRQSPVLIGSVGWRSDFDGADADARLDNALSAASDGDTIHLEPATYTDDRTIDTEGVLKGGSAYISGAEIGSSTTWTLSNRAVLYQIYLSGSVVADTSRAQIGRLYGQGSITLKSSANILFALNGTGGPMSVTFENGTDSGIIDASANVAVTDNGSNTTGDIA